MKKSIEKEAYNIYNKGTTLEESINVINKQEQEIARLKCELNAVKKERDLLIIEASKLKFELEIADNCKKLYNVRHIENGDLSSCFNGSANDSRDCHNECDDEEENSDIEDVTGEDVNDNFKSMSITDSYQYQWHRPTDSIRNNSAKLMNCSRDVTSYELSQDLLEKQIELLERKYGGTRAREAAITIQRGFRRYQLIKKFTHITEMVKAEKGFNRRFQENGNVAAHATNEYACEAKNTACLQANVTPIRSLSMREKRLGELESGSNSLPHGYVRIGRCTSCTYCCNMTNSCSPCCLATPSVNLYSNLVTTNHSKSPDMMRNYHHPHLANCSSSGSSPLAYVNYPPSAMNSSGAHGKYSGHLIYHDTSALSCQLNSSGSPLSQLSTPKKVPPEVPKRTSSISFKQSRGGHQHMTAGYEMNFSHSGSMSSVQSSSSDSSSTMNASHSSSMNMSNNSSTLTSTWSKKPQITEIVRKRQYRVGLNLFNKKPERGFTYLVQKGFLEDTPQAIAKFLNQRKGLSKETIGEYLGGRNPYNQAVLNYYMNEIDLYGMQVDVALRKFVTCFKLPGEAQKIERLMKAFSDRYCRCNREVVSRFEDPDTVFVLAFAIIMLNSDLHTRSMKNDQRMKLDEFITNLRRVVDCSVEKDMMEGIYERVKANEFEECKDHVSQVRNVEATIVGMKNRLALTHRRLVCYCRLYEVLDLNKKEKVGVHQREVFLFNDLLVVTKILSKKKGAVTYTFRQSYSLSGLHVSVFQTQYYQFGIRLMRRVDNQELITFNARNDHDQRKFVEDIRESIMEMDEMENIRIEAELERQKSGRTNRCSSGSGTENRDSGVADVEVCQCLHGYPQSANLEHDAKLHTAGEQSSGTLKRSALSNSLLDIHDQGNMISSRL